MLSNVSESSAHVVAWTLADLADRERPGVDEVAVALAMRRGEQPGTVRETGG